MSAAAKVDTVVIGAGVIGLAVARALSAVAAQNNEVLLVDRAARIGSETSSRNSEVIHAGIYYPFGSRKATWCVRGKNLLYQYCRDKSIPHQNVGKLVVATQPEHLPTLQKLHQQSADNGVETKLLSAADTLEREPTLSQTIQGALWSPTTGIVDSHSFMVQLLSDAEQDGSTTLALHTAIEDAEIGSREQIIRLYADGMWLSCRQVVNCAGLWADGIARMIHSATTADKTNAWEPPQQYYAKGTYFRPTSTSPKFSHLVYPVPDPLGGLGVHATLDLQGQIKFGPDVEWMAVDTAPDEIDLQPDPSRAESFYESIRSYWPDLKDGSLVPDYTGVRPKLQHPSLAMGEKLSFADFLVAGPETHGVPGLVHLFGMESPGLTSSMAIAEHVASMLEYA